MLIAARVRDKRSQQDVRMGNESVWTARGLPTQHVQCTDRCVRMRRKWSDCSMWMVRSDGGKQYDYFRERGAAGIGFPEVAEIAKPGVDRKSLLRAFLATRPGA